MGIYPFWLGALLFSLMAIFMGQGSVLPVTSAANGIMQKASLSGAEQLEGTGYLYAPEKQAALPSRNVPRLTSPGGGSVLSERASLGVETARGPMRFTLGYAVDLVAAAVLIPVLLRCYRRTAQSRGGGGYESNLLYRFIHTRK